MISEIDLTSATTKTFEYDALGNLKKVVLPTKTIQYKVNSLNKRTLKLNGSSIEEFYIWDGDNLIGIADGSGALKARFVYGSKNHIPDYMIKNNVSYQIITNHLGSPVAIVDSSSGQVAQKVTYDEFGNILSDSQPGFSPFGFAGCLFDHETSLCRFGARDYDASIGRWLSKDPILFAGGDTNLYGYVLQDPINFIDPMGTTVVNASGYPIPGQVQDSMLYRILHNDPSKFILISNFNNSKYDGLTTGNSIQINFGRNGGFDNLVDTFIDELSHAYGNNYYPGGTSERFDHNVLKPYFLNDDSLHYRRSCGY